MTFIKLSPLKLSPLLLAATIFLPAITSQAQSQSSGQAAASAATSATPPSATPPSAVTKPVQLQPAAIVDRTDAALKEFGAQGMTQLGTVKMGKGRDVSLALHLTQGGQKLMDAREFDIPDADFEQAKFETYVAQKFGNALSYLLDRVPDWPGREVHIILSDTGEDRKLSTAFTVRGSRVIEVDIRRWHKVYRRYDISISETTPVHELTHVLQGLSDAREEKYHRELSAIVVELAFLRYRVGPTEPVFLSYPRFVGPTPLAAQVLDPNNLDPSAWRVIAHKMTLNILGGVYTFAPAGKASGKNTATKKAPPQKAQTAKDVQARQDATVAALERFAIRYARHPETGDKGFEAACRESGLLDAKGQALTLDTLRRDTARDLASPVVSQTKK